MPRRPGAVDSPAVSAAEQARTLFAPLGPTYDRSAALLSYGQDPRWRAFLVSRIDAEPGDRVLDVATGTGAVARELARRKGCASSGSTRAPRCSPRRAGDSAREVELVEARPTRLPFADGEFDALTFTYLLRYVDDPRATLRELARVVRPGGVDRRARVRPARRRLAGALGAARARRAAGCRGRCVGRGWREVGRFLGPSIRGFNAALAARAAARGLARRPGSARCACAGMSLGGGVVTWGRKRLGPPSTR